ncbi:Protein CBG24734 [Caenorhabditis briggsae]|uniref:Protein CBG24734 n=1 Tax=Caenorhabditis briggsae TaxID=6238 RepID=A8WLC8_CAEBR|nr:Protein CBG24734 [Caenorhabditis briggsae]CAP21273.1 Protein CBG24734 [Caenorhabditis briggsae]
MFLLLGCRLATSGRKLRGSAFGRVLTSTSETITDDVLEKRVRNLSNKIKFKSTFLMSSAWEISQLEKIKKKTTGCQKIRRKTRKLIRQRLFSHIRHDSQRHLQNLKI